MGDDLEVTRSSDPKLVASRIFIGNLPTDKCTQAEVKDYFQKYGVVLGVSLFKGFGFVQFRELPDAQTAVHKEHMKFFKGQKMDIRLASEGRKKREIDSRPSPQPPPRMPEAPSHSHRRPVSPDPYHSRHSSHYDSHYNDYAPGAYDRHGQPLDPYYKPHPGPSSHPVDVLASMAPQVPNQAYMGMGGMSEMGAPGGRYPQPPVVQPGVPVIQAPLVQAPPVDTRVHHSTDPVSVPPVKRTDVGVERPFDCAILVAEKDHRSYAEMVERRLLELNLSVDLLFLIEQEALPKLVEAFSHKGLLYLILVQKQHQEHKSVTVNILHGTPQEHRNMPLEDALLMLSRDFNGYLSKLRCGSEQPSLNFLLHLISDGKNLSHGELERAIQHLTERKNQLIGTSGNLPQNQNIGIQQQSQTPVAPTPGIANAVGPVSAKTEEKDKETSAAELQKKIMSILGGSSGGPNATGAGILNNLGNKPVQPPSDQPPAKIPALASSRAGIMGSMPETSVSQASPGSSQQQGSLDIHKTLNNLLQNPDALKNILPKQQGYQGQSQPGPHPLNPYDSRAGATTTAAPSGGSYGNGFMGGSYHSLSSNAPSRNADNMGMGHTNTGNPRGMGGRGLLDNPMGQ